MVLASTIDFTLPLADPVLKFLLILLIILAAPLLLNKLRIPHLLGLIIAGAIIGPHGFNLVLRDSSPAEVTVLAPGRLSVTIHEGRNRQVRRLCALAGLRVRRLVRVAEGQLRLGTLAPRQWRPLTEQEITYLKSHL